MEIAGLELESKDQVETDPLIKIFKLIDVKKKTLEYIQLACGLIVATYVLAWLFLHYFDAYNTDILVGIESLPLIISAIVYTVANIYLKKHRKLPTSHWRWDIFVFILVGINFYGFAYSPHILQIPQKYVWAGPTGTFIVGIIFFLDMRRSSRKFIIGLKK
ncbi:MAG: hypothetical protein GPJ54_00055 [Candidatus Heimdallarchaeota archaeon]|nr:hypothetical protein [Candidatus Heimdallarchaeota archaeon]